VTKVVTFPAEMAIKGTVKTVKLTGKGLVKVGKAVIPDGDEENPEDDKNERGNQHKELSI